MRQTMLAATTRWKNSPYTREVLQHMAEQQNGNSALMITIEHDRTVPPSGKVLRAWIEQAADGELDLYQEQEFFGDPETILGPDGEELFLCKSAIDGRPFIGCSAEPPSSEITIVSIDRANFENDKDLKAFADEIAEVGQYRKGMIPRYSAVPDPLTIIEIAVAWTLASSLTKKTSDKCSEVIANGAADEIAQAGKFAKKALIGLVKHAVPKKDPVAIIVIQTCDPVVELVFTDAEKELADLDPAVIEKALQDAINYKRLMKATKVQFVFNGTKWTMSFLVTEDGAAIGTDRAMKKKAARWRAYQNHKDLLALFTKKPKD